MLNMNKDKLTPTDYERLGDAFLARGREADAKRAYIKALELYATLDLDVPLHDPIVEQMKRKLGIS